MAARYTVTKLTVADETSPPGRGPVTTLAILFSVVTLHLFSLINASIPEPYMDEIFHIKQARAYCEGNFTQWDPKLTTLPGLYFVSLAQLKFLQIFVSMNDPCTYWNFRLTNYVFAVAGIFLFYQILCIFHPKGASKLYLLLSTLNLATFPLLYFFSFLYYTDQASTFFVLAMFYLHALNRRNAAALLGALAVTTRQTNIVWVGSLAVLELFKTYQLIMQSVARKEDLKKIAVDKDLQVLIAPFQSLLRAPTSANLKRLSGLFLGVFVEGLPCITGYIAILVGFFVFIVHNQGIVVGDRSAHEAAFHAPQLFYFTTFTLFFAAPFLLTPKKVKLFFLDCIRAPFVVIFTLSWIVALIGTFTYAHPYLLADNRHYTFYIWNRLFQRHFLVKYALAPLYVYGLWAMWSELRQRGFLRVALCFAACSAVLIPQRLLEFRYFIVPYLLFRIQLPRQSIWQVVLEFALYQLVSGVTLYLFLYKPFKWRDVPELQHFMW